MSSPTSKLSDTATDPRARAGPQKSTRELSRDHRRRLVRPGAFLVRYLFPLVGRTYRLRILGREHLDRILQDREPVVLAFWHDRSVVMGYLLYRLHRQGMKITLLASHSRDGQLLTYIGAGLGFDIVRGSASRGGREAIMAMRRAIRQQRSSPVASPDGPRGPLHHFKIGVLKLAQLSGAPVLPMSFAAASSWTLGSWDRMTVPRPFSRVVVTVGAPESVPRELTPEREESERARLEQVLGDLGRSAEALLHSSDSLIQTKN